MKIEWNAKGNKGAVAAGHPDSVRAGIELLSQKGNAVDAAVAVILALSITDYGAFAIGGEVPFIVYDANKKEVKVLCGLGFAPLNPESIAWFYKNGIYKEGHIKDTPVPGAVSLCFKALQLYGTKSFEQVSASVLKLLDTNKEEWYKGLSRTFNKLIETEKSFPGSREDKLGAARDRFYKGDIAEVLVKWYKEQDGFLSKKDLEEYETLVEEPVSINYKGYQVYKCNTWTQGPGLLQALKLLEGFDLKQMESFSADHIHVVIEALKLAFADRDEYYGDPGFVDVPLKQLLSADYTGIRQKLIDMSKCSKETRPGDPANMLANKKAGPYFETPGGTTTCCVADQWGNVVSATPSCNRPYHVEVNTGITHGNRLRSLNTLKGHPNCIEPGKRPRITLTPTLVCKNEKPVLAVSVAGGDLQDQTTLNILLNFIEFGMMPAEAVTAPRFCTSHHQDSFDPNGNREEALIKIGNIIMNPGIDETVRNDLIKRGHEVIQEKGSIAHPIMIHCDPEKETIYAAGDPSAGRHAHCL